MLASVISPNRRFPSTEMDLSQAHMEDTPKRKGTNMFGGLERELAKIVTALTRNKEGSAKDGPRRQKLHYDVTTTSLVNPADQLLKKITAILPKKNMDFIQKGYTLKCQTHSDFGKVTMQFEMEVCQLQRHDVEDIRRQRLKGDAWAYKRLVEDTLSGCKM